MQDYGGKMIWQNDENIDGFRCMNYECESPLSIVIFWTFLEYCLRRLINLLLPYPQK